MLELNIPTGIGIALGLLIVGILAYVQHGKPTIADYMDAWRNSPENKDRMDKMVYDLFGVEKTMKVSEK